MKILLPLILAILSASSASASLVTLRFEGEVDVIPPLLASSALSAGDTAKFSFTFNPAGLVDLAPSPNAFSVVAEGARLELPALGIDIEAQNTSARLSNIDATTPSGDDELTAQGTFAFLPAGTAPIAGQRITSFQIRLVDTTDTVFDGDDLGALTELDLADFDSAVFFVITEGAVAPEDRRIVGTIDRLAVTSTEVPLPAAGILFTAGLGALAGFVRR